MTKLEQLESELNTTAVRLKELRKEPNENWNEYRQLLETEEQLRKDIQHETFVAYKNIQVGDGITLNLYSDAHAFTVIKRTKNTITVQRDKATLKETFTPEFSVGGFFAHCSNQDEQDYNYEQDPNGRIIILRWNEKKKKWLNKKYCVSTSYGRNEYYDYNY